MTSKISDILGLPERQPIPDELASTAPQEFREQFTDLLQGINESLRSLVIAASPDRSKEAYTKRDNLVAAYQSVLKKQLAGKSAYDDMQKVIKAAESALKQLASMVKKAAARREKWIESEGQFDDAVLQINELKDQAHPKAGQLNKVTSRIASRAREGDYQSATTANDLLQAELTKVRDDVINPIDFSEEEQAMASIMHEDIEAQLHEMAGKLSGLIAKMDAIKVETLA